MHRIRGHEGKCAAFHGHRYVAEIAISSDALDKLGRVVDFSVVKTIVGGWIDANWDHTALLDKADTSPAVEEVIRENAEAGRPVYFLNAPPTVEQIVVELAAISIELLSPHGLEVSSIRLWETPNCSALWKSDRD